MSDYSLVLKNCNLINENSIQKVDIGIKDDRIDKIAGEITSQASDVIDLKGIYAAPGIIDDQVTSEIQGSLKREIFTQNL